MCRGVKLIGPCPPVEPMDRCAIRRNTLPLTAGVIPSVCGTSVLSGRERGSGDVCSRGSGAGVSVSCCPVVGSAGSSVRGIADNLTEDETVCCHRPISSSKGSDDLNRSGVGGCACCGDIGYVEHCPWTIDFFHEAISAVALGVVHMAIAAHRTRYRTVPVYQGVA